MVNRPLLAVLSHITEFGWLGRIRPISDCRVQQKTHLNIKQVLGKYLLTTCLPVYPQIILTQLTRVAYFFTDDLGDELALMQLIDPSEFES